jgi:hypothetical protein
MKTLVALIAAAAIVLTAGLQVFAADDGRVADEPTQIQQYEQAQ